jgi:hypothetical protein
MRLFGEKFGNCEKGLHQDPALAGYRSGWQQGAGGQPSSCSEGLGCEFKSDKSTFVQLPLRLLSHCQNLQQQHSESVWRPRLMQKLS